MSNILLKQLVLDELKELEKMWLSHFNNIIIIIIRYAMSTTFRVYMLH